MEARRWARFGQDRLYVHDDTGQEIGWWDLVTNEGHPANPEAMPILTAEVDGWRERRGMPVPRRAAAADGVAGVPKRAASDATQPTKLAHPRTAAAAAPVSAGVLHAGPSFAPPANTTPLAPCEPPTPPRLLDTGVDVRVLNARAGVAPAGVDLLENRAGQNLHPHIVAAATPAQASTAQAAGAASSWEKGAIGEALVADELARLVGTDPRWGFLNSVPVGRRGADIDHIIIGPGGVFTINAKHHDGANIWVGEDTFMVNGHRQRYVRNSRHEAKRAAKLLAAASGFHIPVRGVIVPVNAAAVDIRKQPEGVDVVDLKLLTYFLWTLPVVLNHHTVQAVFEHARDSTTWTS